LYSSTIFGAAQKKETEMPQWINVTTSENSEKSSEPIEIEIDSDGGLRLTELASQFPGATGLRYRNPETNRLRAVKAVSIDSGQQAEETIDVAKNFHKIVLKSPLQSTLQSSSKHISAAANKPDQNNKKTEATDKKSNNKSSSSSCSAGSVGLWPDYLYFVVFRDKDKNNNLMDNSKSSKKHNSSKGVDNCSSRAVDKSSSSKPLVLSDNKRLNKTEKSSNVDSENKSLSDNKKFTTDLVVLGLPWKATEQTLNNYFSKLGDLIMVQVKREPSGKSRGYGFIRFSSYESQKKALAKKHQIDGRWCEVKMPHSKNGDELARKIFVGRITPDLTREVLRSYFTKFGEITDVFIPSPFRAFAFIQFEDAKIAQSLCGDDHLINGVSVYTATADPKNNSNILAATGMAVQGGSVASHTSSRSNVPNNNYANNNSNNVLGNMNVQQAVEQLANPANNNNNVLASLASILFQQTNNSPMPSFNSGQQSPSAKSVNSSTQGVSGMYVDGNQQQQQQQASLFGRNQRVKFQMKGQRNKSDSAEQRNYSGVQDQQNINNLQTLFTQLGLGVNARSNLPYLDNTATNVNMMNQYPMTTLPSDNNAQSWDPTNQLLALIQHQNMAAQYMNPTGYMNFPQQHQQQQQQHQIQVSAPPIQTHHQINTSQVIPEKPQNLQKSEKNNEKKK